jgi:putative DNA primase/helicase
MRRPTPPTPAVAVPAKATSVMRQSSQKLLPPRTERKFRRLWDGDITGYKSQSEADAALVATLAFWCSGDKAQMDRLFRQSGLMREKWDTLRGADTYGNISIEKAVARLTDYYKPIIPRSAAEDFGVESAEGT